MELRAGPSACPGSADADRRRRPARPGRAKRAYRLAAALALGLLVLLGRVVGGAGLALGAGADGLLAVVLDGVLAVDGHLVCHVPPGLVPETFAAAGGKRLSLLSRRGNRGGGARPATRPAWEVPRPPARGCGGGVGETTRAPFSVQVRLGRPGCGSQAPRGAVGELWESCGSCGSHRDRSSGEVSGTAAAPISGCRALR